MSSATAIDGCVSFICTAQLDAKDSIELPASRWIRIMSCSEQETKKYCWASRSCFPYVRLVIGVEHLSDGLGADLLVDGPEVVPYVEGGKIERFSRLRLPEPKEVSRVHPVSQNGRVVGDPLDTRRESSGPGTAPFSSIPLSVLPPKSTS